MSSDYKKPRPHKVYKKCGVLCSKIIHGSPHTSITLYNICLHCRHTMCVCIYVVYENLLLKNQ